MAGKYKIVVNISNLATAVSKEVTVVMIETITRLIINAKSSADRLSSRSLSSPSGNIFPIENSVLFKPEYDGDVKIINLTHYNFGDGYNKTTSADITGERTYSSIGEYTVTVTLKHRFGEFSNSTKVMMKERIAGLKISDDAPTVVNKSMNFTLNMDKLGTDTLIEVDFGDGQKIIFGENSNNVNIPSMVKFQAVSASAKSISFLHVYEDTRLYDVKVDAWNDVSSKTISHRTVTVDQECRYPDLQILGIGANPKSAPNVPRDREMVIYTRIIINCKASYATVFEWNVEHDSQNKSIPIQINTDLNQASLTIPPHLLPYGIITLRFAAKMKYFIDGINSHAVGYINVLSTKLKAKIFGGHFRTVSSQRMIRLNGSISEDPDVGQGNLSGIRFSWFCRRASEIFPLKVEELSPVMFADISLHAEYGGCEGSGPRMLNYSTPELEISPGMLRDDEKYVFKLIIKKDIREATFEQTIQVFEKVLPEVAIK